MLGTLLYPLAVVLGMLLSAWAWERHATHEPGPDTAQKHAIFLGALVGMAIGSKLAYLFAEGLRDPHWQAWLHGKSVTGALPGAYAGVELAKRRVGYARATGDTFALLAPFSLALGRVGCLARGCCLGVPVAQSWWSLPDAAGVARWPAVPLELAFNLLALAAAAWMHWRRKRGRHDALHGQLFHVYLMAYGIFRLAHEVMRDTPRLWGPVTGYQVVAAGVFTLGAVGFARRRGTAWKTRPTGSVTPT
jgi:phosphatidylglycerol:prolipoprotein diacylglycerol transferase